MAWLYIGIFFGLLSRLTINGEEESVKEAAERITQERELEDKVTAGKLSKADKERLSAYFTLEDRHDIRRALEDPSTTLEDLAALTGLETISEALSSHNKGEPLAYSIDLSNLSGGARDRFDKHLKRQGRPPLPVPSREELGEIYDRLEDVNKQISA